MRLIAYRSGIREHRLLAEALKAFGSDSPYMEPLGGLQRTKESSIGAVTNIAGGIGQVITGTGGRIKGVLRMGQGVLDAFDIVPSLAADGVRKFAGTPSNSYSPSRFNITRALSHARDIRTDNVVDGVLDAGAVVVDNIHSIGFKAGSDALKALRMAA